MFNLKIKISYFFSEKTTPEYKSHFGVKIGRTCWLMLAHVGSRWLCIGAKHCQPAPM
jgi:hypothetical protein